MSAELDLAVLRERIIDQGAMALFSSHEVSQLILRLEAAERDRDNLHKLSASLAEKADEETERAEAAEKERQADVVAFTAEKRVLIAQFAAEKRRADAAQRLADYINNRLDYHRERADAAEAVIARVTREVDEIQVLKPPIESAIRWLRAALNGTKGER